MSDHGRKRPGSTIYFYFESFAGSNAANITASNFATTDIRLYRNGSPVERASQAGYALLDTDGVDFDGLTGIHGFSVDTSDNTDPGFFVVGAHYQCIVGPVTIDGQSMTFLAGWFVLGVEGAIRDTTIATLASQTSFTLTAGPANNNALVGCRVILQSPTAANCAVGIISGYVGSTRTVTLLYDPAAYTMAAGDNISILPPDLADLRLVAGTGQTAGDLAALLTTLTTRLTSGRASNLDFLDASVNAVGVAASSAAALASSAASSAATAATQSTNAAASAASADTKATTILNRLGAWTGTGLNTILGALRALANKATGITPTDLSTGGTFDNTTDSAEAIRDRGDAAWGAGGSITPPIAYYEGRLTLTADEAGIDGRIVRYAGDPLQIAVQMRTATGPVSVDGYTLVPSMVDSANADAGALTTTVQLASEGDLLIDGTTPAQRGIYRITCRLGAGGQTFGPLLLEVI